VKSRREGLGLTQRSLAEKLGVEASHIAFIESGRRKPSLKLIARLADILGIDRQTLLILTHPEAQELSAEAGPLSQPQATPSWQRFIKNHKLLTRYGPNPFQLTVMGLVSSSV